MEAHPSGSVIVTMTCLSSLASCCCSTLRVVGEVAGIGLFTLASSAFRGDLPTFFLSQAREPAASPFTFHLVRHIRVWLFLPAS